MIKLKISGLLTGLLLFVFAFNISQGGNLKLKPENPLSGSLVKIEYESDGRFADNTVLFANIYSYKASAAFPTAYEIQLRYNKAARVHEASFTVPAEEVFALIKISDGTSSDDNRSKFWDYQIVDKDNNIVRSAYLQAGISYLGNAPSNCNRRVNFNKALKMLKKENLLYPNNIQALIGAVSLRLDLGLISYDKFEESVTEYVNRKFNKDDENDVKSVTRALRTLNMNEKAEDIEKRFARTYPKSETAQELYMSKLSQADNLDDFSKIVQDFLKAFPKSSNREKLFSALVSGYLQSGKSEEIKTVLKSFRSVPSSAYTQLAYAIVETDEDEDNMQSNLAKASALMKKADNEAGKNKTHLKPVYMTGSEWKKKRNRDYIRVLEANAEVLLWAKNYAAALDVLDKAKKAAGGEIPGTLYALYIDFYSSTSDAEKALATASNAIHYSQSSESIEEYHKILFDSLRPEAKYESFISAIQKFAQKKRLKKLKYKKLDMSAELGIIKSVNGKALDLERQQGKIVIIELWATWCGPCREALTSFDNLASKYAMRKDIVFVAAAVWEKGENVSQAVNDFIADAELKVPAYIDSQSELPKNIGISGLPARIYIGKNGKIQFIETGFTDAFSYKRSAEDKIELLTE